MQHPSSAQSTVPDNDALARFREVWKAEVAQRAQAQSTLPKAPIIEPLAPPEDRTSNVSKVASAIQTYRLAVHHEQQGQLDDALRLYRQAFRVDPNVDRAYHSEEMRLQTVLTAAPASGIVRTHRKISSSGSNMDQLTKGFGALVLSATGSVATVTGTLAKFVSGFPSSLSFEPEDERHNVSISRLPDELLILILMCLESTSIERFAAVNRKARVLSLDPAIWRKLVYATYMPPQTPAEVSVESIAQQYLFDYRRFYVEHPRVRLDGVYIAVCHYIRPGLSENPWVKISHLITYHRYLRFLRNGQVLSLLAGEEVEPQTIVPLLKPNLVMKGLFIGNWALHDNIVSMTNLADPSGKVTRYTFQMTLSLRSRPMGRWNKLDIAGYDSVNSETGEVTPLPLKHDRPFWFSKVKSYHNG